MQIISDSKIGFRLKNSPVDIEGGVISQNDPVKFAESITVWTLDKTDAVIYILGS